jgi:RND family efflux transporter MFP subunit
MASFSQKFRIILLGMTRVTVTAIVVALAVLGGYHLWIHYNVEPWTRDGRVRADVVQVSPDVSGIVSEVHVHNDQAVRCGQVLFVVDQARFELAVREAQAAVEADEAALDQARKVSRRDQTLTNLVTGEQIEADSAKVLQLIAQLRGAQVLRDTAKLNLERSTILASVNGIVTNLELQPGDFATAGHQVLALLDTDAVYVDAYFEETKLPSIQVGDRARVHLMGVRAELQGSVTSVAGGIEDRERGASSTALANINPTFSWVRLAQRIPVRVELQNVPQDIRLISGRTATVAIEPPLGRALEGGS